MAQEEIRSPVVLRVFEDPSRVFGFRKVDVYKRPFTFVAAARFVLRLKLKRKRDLQRLVFTLDNHSSFR